MPSSSYEGAVGQALQSPARGRNTPQDRSPCAGTEYDSIERRTRSGRALRRERVRRRTAVRGLEGRDWHRGRAALGSFGAHRRASCAAASRPLLRPVPPPASPPEVILVDAGPLVAILSATDQHRHRCVATLRALREPLATVWPAVTEAMHLLGPRP